MTVPVPLPPSPGIGLKPQHYRDALGHAPAETSASRDAQSFRPGWFEVHPQNYFCEGGPPHRWLTAVAERFPISFHSVGLSLGSAGGLNESELAALVRLCARYEPAVVSDHLSWSGTALGPLPDLLPVPYTRACLDHFTAQVSRAQHALGRPILMENPSRYLAFAGDEMDEPEFMNTLCRKAGCGILLDINNIEVSAANLGLDPFALLDRFDAGLVGEVHLAGHATEKHPHGDLLIDDHGSPVSDLTWRLFRRFVARAGHRPVLIEWDTNVPDYATLAAQAAKAGHIMREETLADVA